MPHNYDPHKDAAQLRALSYEKLTWLLILIAQDLRSGTSQYGTDELDYQQQMVTAEIQRREQIKQLYHD
jgi:hypothetical protein